MFAYSHNLVRVYMECDYTSLNHNLLMSQKKWSPRVWLLKGFSVVVQVGAVKIYVATMEALKEKKRGDETQFTTTIGGKKI